MAIPISMRSYGMGETGVADDSDPANAFYNPALLASMNGAFLTVGYSNLIPMLADDVSIFNIGAAGGIQMAMGEANGLGLAGAVHYAKLDCGKWRETTAEGIPIGDEHKSSERYFRFTLAGGLKLSDVLHLGVGASAKHVEVSLVDQLLEDTKWAGDVGLSMKAVVSTASDF